MIGTMSDRENANAMDISSVRPTDRETPRIWWALALVVGLGTVLRLWGLGTLSLHGDEETMALPVAAILEVGAPMLPSGMEYIRAFPHLYLMAASVSVFGETEWACRFPSAVIGIVMILCAYAMGRRFHSADWSIVLALIVALLPIMIAHSQTARMYIFYSTLVVLLAAAIFRWERTESLRDYGLALLVAAVSLSFHVLTVFSSLLFFFPGLVKRSFRLLVYGGAAFALTAVAYLWMSEWISSSYFDLVRLESAEVARPSATAWLGSYGVVLVAGILASAAYLGYRGTRTLGVMNVWSLTSVALLAVSVVSAGAMSFHIAALAFAAGGMLYTRSGGKFEWLGSLGVALGVLFAVYAFQAVRSGEFEDINAVVMHLLGLPNPWPYLIFSSFFRSEM